MNEKGSMIGTANDESGSRFANGVDFDRVWHGISGGMWASEPRPLERFASRVMGSPALAKALVATPSLFGAWLLATVLVLILGVIITRSTTQPVLPLLAPAVAGIGVSFAYGRAADPAWEITRTVAVPERLLLLVRVVAVFLANSILGIAATMVSGRFGEITLYWLIPMSVLSMVGLAVAVTTKSAAGGSISALVIWSLFVGREYIVSRTFPNAFASEPIVAAMPIYTVLALLSLIAIWISTTDTFNHGAHR